MIKIIKKAGNFFYYSAPMGRGTIEDGGGGIIFPAFLIKMLKKAGKNHYT
jgi:hypothetical protein